MTHTLGYHEVLFLILATILGIVIWMLAVTPASGG